MMPPESPQIRFRQTGTPPKFEGLTLPSALRELCAQPENSITQATPKATPRRTEMSALAKRFHRIQLDSSPTEKSSVDNLNVVKPSRLDFNEDVVDKENVSEETSEVGTAVWEKLDENAPNGRQEKRNEDAFENAAASMKTEILDVVSESKDGKGQDVAVVKLDTHLNDKRSEADVSGFQNEKSTTAMNFSLDAQGSDILPSNANLTAGIEQLKGNLQKILEGRNKWPWLERCRAMCAVTEILSQHPDQEILDYTESVLQTLSSKLNDHLDELRPSVITSALGLLNAIISLKLDGSYTFSEEVFPSVMDLACGRSLTAQEAAKSLALLLHHHADLEPILEDADNIDRLCDILKQQANSLRVSELRDRANSTLAMAQKVAGHDTTSASHDNDTSEHGISASASTVASPKGDHSPQIDVPSSQNPQVRNPSFLGRLSGRSSGIYNLESANGLSCNSVRLPHSPNGDESQSRNLSPRVANTSVEVRNGVTVIRNTKLRGSGRKLSPVSARKQLVYSEGEVEELCRKAVQSAREEASLAYERDRKDLAEARDQLERKLRTENSQVEELKGVLEEYQLTMQTMVAQGNTKISAQNTTLVSEKNRLKAELLEVSESFETLKEKYEDSKKTMELFESKENRFIEQIKELKKNMIELQKWSNDLKANTEKKLSKAFESVTSYRASYIDKEAHAEKAISDLERTRVELEREQLSHTQTAAKFSQAEAKLHTEQDARSAAEASLTTTKASLARMVSQKERLQSELEAVTEAFSDSKTKLLTLESQAARAAEVQSQLDSATVKNQSLKARAYDDMTRIKSLEAVIREKDVELEEMSAICEEAMERLERGKLIGS